MRHTSLLVLALTGLLQLLPSQQTPAPGRQQPAPRPQTELQKLRDARVARAAFQKAPWVFDYDTALATAATQGKALLAYFTTSSAPNAQCDALEDGLLSDPAFAEFAKSYVLFAHVTSNVDGEKYPRLLHQKGLAILPTLCFLDQQGNLIAQPRRLDLAELGTIGGKVRTLLAARAAAAATPGPATDKALFFAEFAIGKIPPEQLEARLAKTELTTAERTALDPQLVDARMLLIVRSTTEANRTENARLVAEMHAAGRKPTDATAFQFWGFLLHHAAKAKDGQLADQACAELERHLANKKDSTRMAAVREQWQKLVDEAKQH